MSWQEILKKLINEKLIILAVGITHQDLVDWVKMRENAERLKDQQEPETDLK